MNAAVCSKTMKQRIETAGVESLYKRTEKISEFRRENPRENKKLCQGALKVHVYQ